MLLTGHVPPGYTTPRAVRWMYPQFNKKFVDLVLRHSDVITAMHFGHEHHDNFRLFYNSSGLFIHDLQCISISHLISLSQYSGACLDSAKEYEMNKIFNFYITK